MKPDASSVAAVIVSYRARPYLEACLRSLGSIPGLADCVVVDNASQDGTADAAREFQGIRVIENDANVGFAGAANQGAQATRTSGAPFVLLLNCDVELTAQALAGLLAVMHADSRCAAASARLVTAGGHDQLPFKTTEASRVKWAPGACLLLRREACDAVGWFDPRFFFYNEDVDLGIRLRRARWHIWYVPEAAVVHHEGKSTDAVRHETIVHGYRGGLYLVEKHYRWALGLARAAIRTEIRVRGACYRGLETPNDKQQAFMRALPALLEL